MFLLSTLQERIDWKRKYTRNLLDSWGYADIAGLFLLSGSRMSVWRPSLRSQWSTVDKWSPRFLPVVPYFFGSLVGRNRSSFWWLVCIWKRSGRDNCFEQGGSPRKEAYSFGADIFRIPMGNAQSVLQDIYPLLFPRRSSVACLWHAGIPVCRQWRCEIPVLDGWYLSRHQPPLPLATIPSRLSESTSIYRE